MQGKALTPSRLVGATTIILALFLCVLAPLFARAAPYLPTNDQQVLEILPVKPGDPALRELRAMRAALARDPKNPERAVEVAQRYFDMASAEGDPRYIGYAEALIRPWFGKDMPVEVQFTRALLRQYRHDFTHALEDLDAVLSRDPGHADALAWKWALYMVMADYTRAREGCDRRKGVASALAVAACFASIDSLMGNARGAYATLDAAFKKDPKRTADYRQWLHTRLGEIALRAGDAKLAEKHFREAIATNVVDGYVLAAYADLMLDQKRYAEVVALLRDWSRSDILLLRLAIAEKALATPSAESRVQTLADRFSDAALRGDKLHLAEEARFELELRGNPARALTLAIENWTLLQREPRDARVLLEVALAAKQPPAARPAMEWLEQTGYEEAHFRELGRALRKLAQ